MIFTVQVKIMPLKDLLDPQGKAVMGGLKNLGIVTVTDVRIGKHISVHIDAENKQEALDIATDAAKKLLANQVMETFEIAID